MGVWTLENNQFDSQDSFFENYQKDNLIKIRNDLKNKFENIDQEIFSSAWRKNKGYIPDGFKFRTLLTIYGPITFKRRVYKYWDKIRYKYVCLTDKKLQIEKYSRVTSHLRFKILEQIATGKRQRDICDMFIFANITRATVSNIIKSSNFHNSLQYFVKNIVKIKIPKYLYINMDETFVKLRKNNKICKYRVRLVTFHTGYDKDTSTEKRKVLANKRVYFQLVPTSRKINTEKFMSSLIRVAKKFYVNINAAKVIIYGDGASWIRTANNNWPNSKYVLDKFHAYRYLKQIFSNRNNKFDWENYQNSKNLFELGAYNDLINHLKQITAKPGKEEKLAKIINYFNHNALGICNQSLEYNIGASAESDVSHIVKWLLGYGSKAFNYQTFKNMLFLKVAEMNQIKVINFLKKQYQLERETIRDFYWKSYWTNKNQIIYGYH